jgi:hypothetical protein
MQRAIARQAEEGRERRIKVIHAEGEAQASEKLAEAANILSVYPGSHPIAVPSDLNGGCDGEKLNDDPSSPDRLTHSVLAEEGEGIT